MHNNAVDNDKKCIFYYFAFTVGELKDLTLHRACVVKPP